MMSRRLLLTSAANLPTSSDYWAHRVHALLGCYVLCHFIYRYTLFFFFSNQNEDHDMGFGDPRTLREEDASGIDNCMRFAKWFLPHLLLQLSGFVFPLPMKRHPDGNRIWPQYRWEALVFCLRCLALSLIAWKRKLYNWALEDGSCSMIPLAICVLLTMASADAISRWYRLNVGMKGSRTIRDLTAPRWAQYLMSSAQFHATVHCLLTSNRLSVQIAALTVVQLSAFGMTLRRKGFISQKEGVLLYALVLLIGMIVIFDDLRRRSLFNIAIFFGNATAVLRMYCGVNKYVMWSVALAVLTYLLKQEMLHDNVSPPVSFVMNVSSWIGLLGSCYFKHQY